MFDPTISLSTDRTNSTSGVLTTDNGRHYLMMRRWSSLLAKELHRTLQKKDSINNDPQKVKLLSSSSPWGRPSFGYPLCIVPR
jgi:hypothetical protein